MGFSYMLFLLYYSSMISKLKLSTNNKEETFAHKILAKSQFKVGKVKIRLTLFNAICFTQSSSKVPGVFRKVVFNVRNVIFLVLSFRLFYMDFLKSVKCKM